jgi:hypothetical protein
MNFGAVGAREAHRYSSNIDTRGVGRDGVVSAEKVRSVSPIDKGRSGGQSSCGRHGGLLDLTWSKNVKDRLAGIQQIVGDDAAMTTPPQRLGAQDSAALVGADGAELLKASVKRFRQSVISKIMKAGIAPESVDVGRDIMCFGSQPAERGEMPIVDMKGLERFRQGVLVVLWIGARARHGTHVGHELNLGGLQEIGKGGKGPRGVSDRKEGAHAVIGGKQGGRWICGPKLAAQVF